MSVTAEGVKARERFERLKGLGVNFAQRYFLGRPQPIERITPEAPTAGSRLRPIAAAGASVVRACAKSA
jgi:EAL domain-containing protein (putative c-di-GMP-specific phosphodiesterase class I)